MRILILSDIHSNLEALEACLTAAPAYDRVVNLGDVVGYGASPNEVTESARSISSLIVRGNHDKACAGLVRVDNFNPIAAIAAYWTRSALTPKNLEWLRTLQEGPLNSPDLTGLQFVHGSPLDEDEYMLMAVDAVEPLQRSTVPVTFFGHTHVQGGFKLDGGHGRQIATGMQPIDESEQHELQLAADEKYLINPGSVGQPRDGDWRAAFSVFDIETRTVTFYRIPYDIKKAQKKILDAQLPERLATRLSMGR